MNKIKVLFEAIISIKRQHLTLHKEGKSLIRVIIMYLLILNGILYFLSLNEIIFSIVNILSIGFFAMVLYFFRNPERQVIHDEQLLYAPADGKIVVIESTEENEFFKSPRLQVSIFMSPLNVHVNRIPVSGEVKYYKYHPGDYLVAWHPKSSTHNERTTVVLETPHGQQLLLRQIAGAVARRIVCYANEGKMFQQGDDLGFIKFGSRVDLFLPLDTKINVNIGDKVIGNKTVIANL
jgi:phosphatidylserine decarboxylase